MGDPAAAPDQAEQSRTPWNRRRLLRQKPPLKPREVWATRIRLQIAERLRDLALFNLATNSKLWGCDPSRSGSMTCCSADAFARAQRCCSGRQAARCSSSLPSRPAEPSCGGSARAITSRGTTLFRAGLATAESRSPPATTPGRWIAGLVRSGWTRGSMAPIPCAARRWRSSTGGPVTYAPFSCCSATRRLEHRAVFRSGGGRRTRQLGGD